MLDSCLHFQQTHRNSRFSYGAAFCNLESGSRIFTRFAFHSLPRQTSGSVAAHVHQLVALTASAGCFGSRRRIYRELFFAVLSDTMLMMVNLDSKVKGCKTETKMLEDTKTLRRAEGEICGFVSTTTTTTKKNRVVILNSTQHDPLRVSSDDTVEGTDPSLVRLFTLVRLCA